MHETLNNNVKGYIDSCKLDNGEIKLIGWCFHSIYNVCNVRLRILIQENDEEQEKIVTGSNVVREDVLRFYKFNNYNKIFCGFKFTHSNNNNVKSIKKMHLESFFDDEWHVVFDNLFENFISRPEESSMLIKVKQRIPSFIVVDDFYENVDSIRTFALKQTYLHHEQYHKGKRTDEVFRFTGLKESFESILNCGITNWDKYGVNGCFQYCIGGDQIVYHVDTQEYAGIIFLSNDAPPQTGTSFYRSKHTKKRKLDGDKEHDVVFKNGFLDSTEFELVDVVGNVYNRLVLFDSQMFHAASSYFGNNIENGRLFQLFFFDLVR